MLGSFVRKKLKTRNYRVEVEVGLVGTNSDQTHGPGLIYEVGSLLFRAPCSINHTVAGEL